MAGFDSEFSMRLALFLNRKIEFIDLPYDALPAALESDFRIGWEPSMEYVCDSWHLNWKLRQMASMKNDLAQYRKLILL